MTKKEFKNARLTLRLTQEQFAAKLGYKTLITVSRKEIGTTSISKSDEIIIGALLTAKSMGLS